MRVIVLGSGTCVPDPVRGSPGYLVEADECLLLVDAGPGVLRQAVKAGYSYKEIDAVLLTHHHPDHASDFVPLIHSLMATPGFKRGKPLFVFGSGHTTGLLKKNLELFIAKKPGFEIVYRTEQRTLLCGVEVSSVETNHADGSRAYRITEGERSVVITGDADLDDALVRFASGADLIVADSSTTSEGKMKGHMSSREAGRLAAKGGAGRLLLSHIYPFFDEKRAVSEVRESFGGEVLIAYDLMSLEL
ncbi:MAG: MBL fold metallo-hydrolase [Nitrospirae bacterium]|nr:MAG: MBL fold metallo-hydrolase [Nitrospirota bacterium]